MATDDFDAASMEIYAGYGYARQFMHLHRSYVSPDFRRLNRRGVVWNMLICMLCRITHDLPPFYLPRLSGDFLLVAVKKWPTAINHQLCLTKYLSTLFSERSFDWNKSLSQNQRIIGKEKRC
jgi:hypothetical protein